MPKPTLSLRAGGYAAQGGFALPTVMLMMVAAFSLATAAVFVSVSAQGGTSRDQNSKAAFAAAESGLADAMLRFNRYAATPAAPCAPLSQGAAGAGGWCAPVDIPSGVNGGSVRYWVHPPSNSPSTRCAGTSTSVACMEVVSRGTVAGASRRIDATATSAANQPLFADAAVKAQEWIHMAANSKIHSGVATNGDVTLSSNAQQCGSASVGVGHTLSLAANAGYFLNTNCTSPTTTYAQKQLTLPPVNQGNAPSSNDNGRLFGLDLVSGNKADACFNGVKANGSAGACGARELSVTGNSALTISGSVYSLCKLTLNSNSKLYTAAGANVKIYFDSPEACGQPAGTIQLQLDSNTRITSSSTAASAVALLFTGSGTSQTRIQLNSNTDAAAQCQQNFVIYAPLTDITMNSNSAYCGALGGRTLDVSSQSQISSGTGVSGFVLPNTAAYYVLDPNGFVECAAAAASPANGGC